MKMILSLILCLSSTAAFAGTPLHKVGVSDVKLSFPNNLVARLFLTLEKDGATALYECSGWQASAKTIVTAKSCLINKNGYAVKIAYQVGRSGSVVRCQGETSEHQTQGSLGLVHMTKACIGNFGYDAFSDSILSSTPIYVAGYPNNKTIGTQWSGFGALLNSSDPGRLAYEIDTENGMAGSPVWILYNNLPYVVGVHTDSQQASTQAVRLTQAKVNWIELNKR